MNQLSPDNSRLARQSFDRVASTYDRLASVERSSKFILENLPRRRTSALDVGCGTGILTHELSALFDRVLGIDISHPMLEIARQLRRATNIRYVQTALENFKSEDRFDLVVSHTTLHHVSDLQLCLTKLRSMVAPAGVLIAVDNTCETTIVPHWILAVSPLFELGPTIRKHGLATALRLTFLRYSSSWLAHQASDRYLTKAEFQYEYGRVLPGAEFTRLGVLMGAVWRA